MILNVDLFKKLSIMLEETRELVCTEYIDPNTIAVGSQCHVCLYDTRTSLLIQRIRSIDSDTGMISLSTY